MAVPTLRCFLLLLIVCACHGFSATGNVTYSSWCNRWHMTADVTVTPGEVKTFGSKVTVQTATGQWGDGGEHATSRVCVLDLRKSTLAEGGDICDVISRFGDVYTISVSREMQASTGGRDLQLVLHSQTRDNRHLLITNVGKLPDANNTTMKQQINVTYELNDEKVVSIGNNFTASATACSEKFVPVKFCVLDPTEKSELKIILDDLEMTNQQPCIEAGFRLTGSLNKTVMFEYTDSLCFSRHSVKLTVSSRDPGTRDVITRDPAVSDVTPSKSDVSNFGTRSDIVFHSSSSSIVPPLTKTLTLRCSLQDSAAPSNVVIGRRELTHDIGPRDLTHTDSDVMYVTSMVVMHDGNDVASISEHVGAQALGNATNIQVTGKISTNPSERGYIELTWQTPLKTDAGEYGCQVVGVSQTGHPAVFSATLEVTAKDISIDDLASFCVQEVNSLKILVDHQKNQLQNQTNQLQNQKNQLQNQTNQLQNQTNQLQNQKNQLQNQINQLQNQTNELQNQKNQLQNQTNQLQNQSNEIHDLKVTKQRVENGTIKCGDSSYWPKDGSYKTKSISEQFKTGYSKSPVVHLSVNRQEELWSDTESQTHYWTELTDVDESGFTITCNVYYKTHFRLVEMWVSWISIGY